MARGIKVSREKIEEIQKLHQQGHTQQEIAEKTGIPQQTLNQYIAEYEKQKTQQQKQSSQPANPPQPPQIQPAKPVQLRESVALPYEEIPEPEDWLRDFLQGYKMKEPFIRAQCARVQRRNQLPTPSDLMVDMKEADSGQKNLHMIRDIVEDYDYAVEDYLKKREKLLNMPLTRRRGIPIRQDQMLPSERMRGGIPYSNLQYPPREQYPPRDPYNPYDANPYYQYPPQSYGIGIPVGPPPQTQPYQSLEQELERLARIQQLFVKTEEKNPALERAERELQEFKQKLDQMEQQRQQEILAELQQYRQQLHQESERRRELEERYRQLEFQQAQKGLTENELKYEELKDRHNLELRKLEEGGKTRETIAQAVKTGFSSIGQAIFRTAQEIGTEDQKEMPGYTDNKNMWQAECPYCHTPITAPLSAKQVICPGCNRQLELTDEQPPTPAPIQIQPQTPIEKQIQTIATCPICNNQMTIPNHAKIVECPHCGKRLEVSKLKQEEPLEIEEEIEEPINVGTYTIEQNIDETFIPESEQPEKQQPELPETKEKLIDWKQQKKIPEPEQIITLTPDERIVHRSGPEPEPIEKKQQLSEPEKKYKCDFCDKTFDTWGQLRGHRIHHVRDKKKQKKKKK